MGDEDGGAGDTQRVKRVAAAAYDYDGDPRWAEYWSNVLIPPHMASRSDVVDHYKRKFYQRFIDPDYAVEMLPSVGSSQSTRVFSRASASPTREQLRPQTSRSGTSVPSGRSSSSVRLDKQSIHFSANAWVFIVALLGIAPLVPSSLSNKAFWLSLLGKALTSFYSVYTLYGMPRSWSLSAAQTWLLSIVSTKDFIHLMYCLVFVSSHLHLKLALIPVVCWSVEPVAKFLRCNFSRSLFYRRYFEQSCRFLEANSAALSILSSNSEVALGFLLIISLVSWQRNILQTVMYWQLLKLMYFAPATAGHHRSIWAKIGLIANPYIYRYAPFFSTPITALQRWWFR